LPTLNSFETVENFYQTLWHEQVHSSGHPSRLGRKGVVEQAAFGSEDYSQEELIAELGSAFLCGMAQIENKTIDNSAAYISGWLKSLKDDQKLIVMAAAQAQKAVDYLTNAQL